MHFILNRENLSFSSNHKNDCLLFMIITIQIKRLIKFRKNILEKNLMNPKNLYSIGSINDKTIVEAISTARGWFTNTSNIAMASEILKITIK